MTTGRPASVTQRVLCPYCAQAFTPARKDATYCSGPCRTAAHRAIRAAEVHPPSLGTRREEHSPERAAATKGYGTLTAHEGYLGDLRVRAIARGGPECRSEWEALDALPGGHERVGLDAAAWAELGARLEEMRREIRAWNARQQ